MFNFFNNEDRFETVYQQGSFANYKVFVDKETGVNYLFLSEGTSAGLTVLVDKNGKSLVTPVNK